MKLTEENYYSREANQHYMSVSQFKDFDKCEAAALAKLNGEYSEPKADCFLIGSYVGATIEGDYALQKFIEDHPEIFSSRGVNKGELKAEYKLGDKMVETLLDDPVCRQMLEGDKEVIVTAELFGVLWKVKLDVYNPDEGRIIDLKTVKGIHERYWKNGKWVSFVENFGYVLQMAVYTELERIEHGRFTTLEPLIVAVSKEETPDKAVICFDEESLNYELLMVNDKLPRIIAVKEGIEEPKRCERCRYCRSTKKIDGLIHYLELTMGS
ncbi:PD-(D/E)XK nuclease-like domain-containing protein [Paenibacillus harenae]|uniref:PD-(D/E)XK nuclease-like domain-containing protein n=1 Tax=Paenibacillus harenae TaxID=306543 RepID=UPI000400AAE7|nr:PD-(D/E)XK nuclease-like domain-containing protein [Paenibacillus harenae]